MNANSEKKYLKWYNKVGYGLGDFGTNYIINFISFFLLWYLTDTVGMNSAVIGTLILVAKIFDGFTDMIFGNMIDRTHTRLGKARPWMLGSILPLCIALVMEFSIPQIGETAKYVYFFVVYVLLNSVFYTVNSIAYATLLALCTKNKKERVQLGSLHFIFGFSAMMLLSVTTNYILNYFGGGVYGWRMTAIVYAIFGGALNILSCLSVKEIPEGEGEPESAKSSEVQNISLIESLKILAKNRFFWILLGINIAFFWFTAIAGSAGSYYTDRVLNDSSKFGILQIGINLPLILTLFVVPSFVAKVGAYKANLIGMIGAVISGLLSAVVGAKSFPLFLFFLALRSVFAAPLMGTLNMLTADVAEYSFLKDGRHIEGSVFSCTSIGNKLGSGFGSAAIGWLLAAAGYVGTEAVQPASALSMISFIYTGIPVVLFALIGLFCYMMKIDKPLQALRDQEKK